VHGYRTLRLIDASNDMLVAIWSGSNIRSSLTQNHHIDSVCVIALFMCVYDDPCEWLSIRLHY
jgi:hypothetical protein